MSEAQMYKLVDESMKWITTTWQHGLETQTLLSHHSVNWHHQMQLLQFLSLTAPLPILRHGYL